MHVKSDSETTACSIGCSTPPRSPQRPFYYVQSPSHSQNEVEKMSSYGSSAFASPTTQLHFHYHCSPIHHSREYSTTSRFSANSLKNPRANHHHPMLGGGGWKRVQMDLYDEIHELDKEATDHHTTSTGFHIDGGGQARFYVLCFVVAFVVLFSAFSLIVWGASLSYKPRIAVKDIVMEELNVQAGVDNTGVGTDMLSLRSRVRILYMNPSTFFGVHVTSTPLYLHYFELQLAYGYIEKFYESRKSDRTLVAVVEGNQVPLYGGIPAISGGSSDMVELNLTMVMKSRAYILGKLVSRNFIRAVFCKLTVQLNQIGSRPLNLSQLSHHHQSSSIKCVYH